MTVEDISPDVLFTSVAYDMRREGYEIFWTEDMPDDAEDARAMKKDWPGTGGGFLTVISDRLRCSDGSTLFLSFPMEKIMRTARRMDDGKKDGFLIAVKAKGHMTNALLICTAHGWARFQLGIFGKKFDYFSHDEEPLPEEKKTED